MKTKKLFTSADYTFCDLAECSKKESCIRHRIHYPQYDNHPRLYVFYNNTEEQCDKYSSIYPVKYLDDINTGIK